MLPCWCGAKVWRVAQLLELTAPENYEVRLKIGLMLFQNGMLIWNKISTLPDDLFTNMPELKNIEFSYTNIVVLQESVFRNIMPQIGYLYLKGNEIDCNCQMKWLTTISKPQYTQVECTKPKALEGLSIEDLTSKHFAHCE
ncbi:hypothetical protein AVEN_62722-1 [Araneus ventricosus]|uniref:LRRCT domain-containing protein n=1 Tax=Araneus ventricosus TaxID=182803 RepID=A0A4Y2WZW5_ARAVE|nr:hypothetical protein AVEN_62722-1 [Araneus ventricosus]